MTGPTTGAWNVPVLFVSFTDEAPLYDIAGFQSLLFDTVGANPDGSLAEYYRDVSRGALQVRGQTFGWYGLSQTRNFYAGGSYGMRRNATPQNVAGMVVEALQKADPEIDFSQFDRDGDGEVDVVLIAHTGLGAEATPSDPTRFWSISSNLSSGWAATSAFVTNDLVPGGLGQTMRVNHFALVPELSGVILNARSEIGVYCHEFGHALGWPDLYDASVLGGATNLGPANWCLMATGLYGGESLTPQRPTRPCAWALADAGWATVENLTASGPKSFEPVDENGRTYRLWWEGQTSSEYYLLENRRRRGTDRDLPGEGLLVYHVEADIIAASRSANRVNSGFIPGLRVEEADGLYHLVSAQNRADSGDPFPGTTEATEVSDGTQPSLRTYAGRYSNLTLSRIETVGDRVEAWVQLQPVGWSDPEAALLPGRPRITDARPIASDGSDLHLIYLDEADLSRVRAVRQRFGAFWGVPAPVSNSIAASDANWTARGPLTALWTDRRHGAPTIYFRPWLPTPGVEERAVHGATAVAYRPAGAWVPGGLLHLVWIDTRQGVPQLYSKRVLPGHAADSAEVFLTPLQFGREVLEFSLDASPAGHLYVAYTLRDENGDEVYWIRFHPGTGWTPVSRLSGLDGYPSGSPDVRIQEDGRVRVIWRDTAPTRTSVRSVLFDPGLGEFVATTDPLFVSTLSLSSVRFASGPLSQDIVLARATESPSDRILVGSRHTDGAWDAGLGWISLGEEAGSHRIAAFVEDDGTTVAVWAGVVDEQGHVVVRRRTGTPASLVGAPPPAPPSAPGGVFAAPNPATQPGVRFTVTSRRAGRLVVYAPTGRRVAQLPVADGAALWDGHDESGRVLPPGIYLYRLEGREGNSPSGKLVWIPR